MKDEIGIRTKDLQRLNAAVDNSHLDTADGDVPISVLQAIYDLVACDDICHLAINPSRRAVVVDEGPDLGEPVIDSNATESEELAELYWSTFWTSLSCSYPYRTGDYGTVHRATDWYDSERHYFSSEIGALMRAGGGRFSLLIPLPSAGPVEHQVIMFRHSGRDFSERDQLLLNLLRPHVADLYLERRRRRNSGGLTARQVQLLDLVAQGFTNGQIARRLDLAEGTIRTHMENILERLDVTSRAAAVARLAELRPAPPPGG